MKVAVCTTIAAYKCGDDRDPMESEAWLARAQDWPNVEWFCALQVGQGHDDKFKNIRALLEEVGATVWTFSVDDGNTRVTSGSRLKDICMGRNLALEYVNIHQDITHLLYLDSDTAPPKDLIEKLVELNHPLTGANVPTYNLTGTQVYGGDIPEDALVHEQTLQTAGCLMMTREVVNNIRWGWSLDQGSTDDPWTEGLAEKLGFGRVWVRHDIRCRHYPESIGPVETRGHDLSVTR